LLIQILEFGVGEFFAVEFHRGESDRFTDFPAPDKHN